MDKKTATERPLLRLGVYGGTFSPPHLGHVHAAEAFLASGEIDRLLLIPTFVTPLKDRDENTSPEDRLAMCRLAFGFSENVTVSDMEIRREGKSYTADTLSALSDESVRLSFLCGTDMFLTMDTWHAPERIFRMAKVVCMRRENDDSLTDSLNRKAEEYRQKFKADVCFLPVKPYEMSSSEIRLRLREKKECSAYLPPLVEAYIREKELYQ